MDAVKLLKQDHRRVKGLFRQLERAKRAADRQRIGQEIIAALSLHAAVEEDLVYPTLRARDPRREEAVLEALEEHHFVMVALAELDAMQASDERYYAKMMFVREAVELHIEEEESNLLPRLARLLSAEELDTLWYAMVLLKEAASLHPHPAAPDTPPGRGVAALLRKLPDTGKDVLRRVASPERAIGHGHVRRRLRAVALRARPSTEPRPQR